MPAVLSASNEDQATLNGVPNIIRRPSVIIRRINVINRCTHMYKLSLSGVSLQLTGVSTCINRMQMTCLKSSELIGVHIDEY